LKKINYYLKNEKQREKIAKKSFEKLKKNFNREKHLIKVFNKIFKNSSNQIMPEINKKTITLNNQDFVLTISGLKEKVKPFDYIAFDNGKCINSKQKNYFLAYSLEKSDADISCSDYYIYSKSLGDYMLFRGDWSFRRANQEFHNLLDINQLMVKKDFFIKHYEDFKNLFNNQGFNLINKKNTIFVSLPLLQIKKLRTISYENMKKSFEIRFFDILLSEFYKKKYITLYPLYLAFSSLKNPFIFKYLKEAIFNKDNWDKLVLNQKYLGGFINKFIKRF